MEINKVCKHSLVTKGGLDNVYQGSVGHALKMPDVDMEFDLHGINRCRAGDCCLNRSCSEIDVDHGIID